MEDYKEKGVFYRLLKLLKGNKKTGQNNSSQNVIAANISHSTIIQIKGNAADEATLEIIRKANASNQPAILSKLLEDKAEECKELILRGNIEKVKSICQALCIYAFEGCNDNIRKKYQFYRFLLSIFLKEEEVTQKQCKEVLSEEYAEMASFLSSLSINYQTEDIERLATYSEEVQVCALEILFTNGQFKRIYELYRKNSMAGVELSFFWFYYVGLSLFNLSDFENAQTLLEKAYNAEYFSLPRYDLIKIFTYIAKIMSITVNIFKGKPEKGLLKDAYNEYKEFKSSCKGFDIAIKGNETLVAAIELQTILNIDIDEFWNAYNGSTSEVRKSIQVINLLGTYYELKNDQKNVFDTYSQLDWRHDDIYLFKMMYSRLSEQNYEDMLRLYNEADEVTHCARVRGLYLLAIREENPTVYEELFLRELENCNQDIEQIFAISFSLRSVEDSKFEEVMYPKIKELFFDILASSDNIKVGYAGLFLRYGHAIDALEVLDSLQVPTIIDDLIADEFYYNLYYYKDLIAEKNDVTSVSLDNESSKEKVADWFISHDILVPQFLTVKINCLYDRNKWLSALELSKKLYDLTEDESVAANIIGLLHQLKSDDYLSYGKYAPILSMSNEPRNLIAAAVAYEALGKYTEADLHCYKALYILNGEDDYEIYDSCFGLNNSMLAKHNNDTINKEIISGNVVVTLKANVDTFNTICESEQYWEVCLDSEDWTEDYATERNHSLGVDHYSSKDSLYLWLQGKRKGDYIECHGKKYCIIDIIDRNFYCGRYVFNKVIVGREKSSIPITKIQCADIEDLKKQLVEFENSNDCKNARQSTENLLDMYHFKNGVIGLPIEAIISCNYDEYLELVGELLYSEDQALYSGDTIVYENYSGKYVLTLSSLAVLSQLNILDILERFSKDFVLPLSLKMFIKNRIERLGDLEQISPVKLLSSPNGNITFIEESPDILNKWKKMYEACESIESVEITDKERTDFKLFDKYDGEALFIKMKFDICQMDSLIIAKKESAVVVIDDLFFRNISETNGIRATNFAFMLYQIEKDKAAEIAMNMSKTNYIKTPLIYYDLESCNKIWNNLLKGKIKRQIYGQCFAELLKPKDLSYTTNEINTEDRSSSPTVMEIID